MIQRAKAVALSYLLIVIKLIVTLVFTPFLVSSLGIAGYGLYMLVGSMAAYLYILDFGMNDAVIRFFVKNEGDLEERDRFLGKMLVLYGGLSIFTMLVTYGLSNFVQPLFGAANTSEDLEMLRQMLLLAGGGIAVLILLNPFGALLSATESFVFLRCMEILVTIVSTLVLVIVLLHGGGPVEVVIVTSLSTIFQSLMRLAYALMYLRVSLKFSWPGYDVLKEVGGYSGPIFLVMIAEALFWRLDNILIGATLGAAPIAIYAIGVTFNKYFMSFATALSRVMTPEIIRQIDRGADALALTDLMIRISRIQAMFLLLVLTSLAVFGERFLILWLGPEFAPSYWIMLAILIPYTLELTGNARNIILQAKGLYWQRSAITLGMAILNVPLTVWLLNLFGVVGAAISTGFAVTVGYVMIALLLRSRVGMDIGFYWRETARRILPLSVILTVFGLLIEGYLPHSWYVLVVAAIIHVSIFVLALYFFAANSGERAVVDDFLRRFQSREGVL